MEMRGMQAGLKKTPVPVESHLLLINGVGPYCTTCISRGEIIQHYGIQDDMTCIKGFCCPLCSYYQVLNEIMVRENLKFGIVSVVPDTDSPPQEDMETEAK